MSQKKNERKSAETFLDVPDMQMFHELMKTIPDTPEVDDKPPAANIKTVMPEPGFCVKTRCEKSGQKVFINVCKSAEIPLPVDISEDELTAILESDDPSNYRVLMSLGEAHTETDKSGVECTAYDVTINTDFHRKLNESDLFKTFLISVSMEGLEDKYGIQLNKNDWIIMKNLAYFGKMSPVTVHDRPKPLITEMASENDSSHHDEQPRRSERLKQQSEDFMAETLAKRKPKLSVPHFSLHKLPDDLAEQMLTAEFHLPKVNCEDIALDVGEDRIKLAAETYDRQTKYVVDIFIPYNVSPALTDATFVVNKEVLLVRMPFATES